MCLGVKDKAKLRGHWQRALTAPRAAEVIHIHPDGSKKSAREILEGALGDPKQARMHFALIETKINLGWYKNVDDYIKAHERGTTQPAP